jgi:magnesium transporter
MIKNIFKDWIHVEQPSKDELSKLVKDYDLELGHLEDALDPFEVSRTEKEDGNIYFFIRVPLPTNELSLTAPILFITVTNRNLPLLDRFIEKDLREKNDKPINLLMKIFKEVNNKYNNSLTLINREIWKASNNIEKINNKDIANFVGYERITNDYLSRLSQNGIVLNQLNNSRYLKLTENDGELAEDLLLANNQLMDISKNSLHSVKNIRDSYSTILSNDLNRVIKLLTSLTIILNVPTMIAGLWGMNVQLPFAKSLYAFELVLLLIVIISVVLIKIFRRKDWI